MAISVAMRAAMAALALAFVVTGAMATYAAFSTANNFAENAAESSTTSENPMHELLRSKEPGRSHEDIGNRIPPMILDSFATLDPHKLAPLDPSTIQITSVTPADRFTRATTPLLAGLTLGVFGLVIFGVRQALQKRSPGESEQAGKIRIG